MDKQERKNYLMNRCYSANYSSLPKPFKTVNALRYVGLGMSIIAYPELFNIQNLTPECTDVLLNSGRYKADAENLEYTLNVFYELNYTVEKMRFIGDEVFAYNSLCKIVKMVLRLPKIKEIELVSSGTVVPMGNTLDLLKNPGLKIVLSPDGEKTEEIIKLLDENEIYWELGKDSGCKYAENAHTVFVEGKIFRCPISAKEYAVSGEADEKSYVDIVAKKLDIKSLRLAMFDITNSAPPEDCEGCPQNKA